MVYDVGFRCVGQSGMKCEYAMRKTRLYVGVAVMLYGVFLGSFVLLMLPTIDILSDAKVPGMRHYVLKAFLSRSLPFVALGLVVMASGLIPRRSPPRPAKLSADIRMHMSPEETRGLYRYCALPVSALAVAFVVLSAVVYGLGDFHPYWLLVPWVIWMALVVWCSERHARFLSATEYARREGLVVKRLFPKKVLPERQRSE